MRAVIIESDPERQRLLMQPLEAADTDCTVVESWSAANPHLVAAVRPDLVICNFEALIFDGLNSLLAGDAQLKVLGIPSILVHDDSQSRDVDAVRNLVSFADTVSVPIADAALTRTYNAVVAGIARITPALEPLQSGKFPRPDPSMLWGQDAQLPPGTVVDGRYEVEAFVEAGGMGQIYRARQQPLGRPVALKVMRSDLAAESDATARFELEARTVSRLTHPNTIVLFDYGVDETRHPGRNAHLMYLAMEWLDGDTLEALLEDHGPIEPERAARLGAQIALSLAEAHQKSIVHRDLKPGNIFVLGNDFVKVLDFGIAKLVDSPEANSITRVGTICGTPEYMSPEQARGDDLDGRSDIYALGCVLYAMLTGEPPFVDDQAIQVIIAHQTQPAPALGPPVPPALTEVVKLCLTKDTEGRVENASRLAELLQKIADGDDAEVLADIAPARLSSATTALATEAVVVEPSDAGDVALDDEFLLLDPFADEAHEPTEELDLSRARQDPVREVVDWPAFDGGSLTDVSPARLIHLAHQGRLTGKLTLSKGRISHSGWLRDGELLRIDGARDTLPGAVGWTEGTFKFEDTDLLPDGTPIPLLPWLDEAIRKHMSVNQVATLFARENDKFPTRTTVYERSHPIFEAMGDVSRVAELCDGQRVLGRLMVDAAMSFERVCHALVLLIDTDAIRLRQHPSRPPLRVEFGERTSSGRVARPTTQRSALSTADQLLVDKLKSMLEQFAAGELHEAFGVRPGAGREAVQNAYARFTRDYGKSRLAKKPTPIPTLGAQVHRHASSAFEELLGIEDEVVREVSEEQARVLEELRAAAERFGASDTHSAFGLTPGCGPGAVDDAYFALVNKHHPDQYASYGHPEIKRIANDVFIALQTTYQTLGALEKGRSPSGPPASGPASGPTSQPNAARPVSQPNAARPVSQPNAAQPVSQPNAAQPVSQPNAAQPNAARPVTSGVQSTVGTSSPRSSPSSGSGVRRAASPAVSSTPRKVDRPVSSGGGRYKVKVPVQGPRNTRSSGSTPTVTRTSSSASSSGTRQNLRRPKSGSNSGVSRTVSRPGSAGTRIPTPPPSRSRQKSDPGRPGVASNATGSQSATNDSKSGRQTSTRKMSDILAERAARRRPPPQSEKSPPKQRGSVSAPDGMADLKSATEHFRQGARFLKQQQLDKALKAFELAARAEPDNGCYEAHVIWARHLTDDLNAESAAAQLKEARKKNDGHGDASIFLGKLAMQRQELTVAKGYFESVLKRNPRNVDAQRELRLVKMRIEQEAENETGLLGRLRRKLRGDS